MSYREFKVSGQIVDVIHKQIFSGTIVVINGKIAHVTPEPVASQQYILPGFIDAHVHIESSMLVPSEFARLAVPHGTVATVSDPHEIANVLGLAGVEYMIENGQKVPFKFYFGAPSCVPATIFETAGAEVTPEDIEDLFQRPEVKYLAEMMNWPGVLNQDPLVMQKITLAQKFGRPIDGHAPGLRAEQARQYAAAGISTDHECFTAEEARDKLAAGMKILIREGSAAKNFEALIDLLPEFPGEIMFCSDDKHPNDLVEGHINQLVKRALTRGIDVFDVLQAACVNPVRHYGLEVGLLRENDPADFIILDTLAPDFKVLETFIAGQQVAERGVTLLEYRASVSPNNFNTHAKSPTDFHFTMPGPGLLNVIEAHDGQLITKRITAPALLTQENNAIADVANDILKIAVVNRYHNEPPAIGFIKNFNLKSGAIASSVAHDSHNIIVVGTDDVSICKAVNLLIEVQGGIVAVNGGDIKLLPLPVAGIMSADNGYEVALAYSDLDAMSKAMGSTLKSPFMTLSFMALLVIPELKLSDQGLFDGNNFTFTPVVIPQ
ncbi:adenine deaminase [Adhaeribacter pallidiroseus]|uniref:Adenine deaminase n=1 Tax=Adhaeribacter pallidiroseus TaxID=2072847 RepID=A0A369QMI7_9BACT|nr:adenine deaminase [Adhaeribacter pallidiroseus]RDC64069.1 Adenine deaminase [Adhaeribacter pallidiroseus]